MIVIGADTVTRILDPGGIEDVHPVNGVLVEPVTCLTETVALETLDVSNFARLVIESVVQPSTRPG